MAGGSASTNGARAGGKGRRARAVVAVAAGLFWLLPGVAPAASVCGGDPPIPAEIASVEDDGIVATSAGRMRVADLDLADPNGIDPRALRWLRTLVGSVVRVAIVRGADRWGVATARLDAGTQAGPVDVADLLVGEGFATVRGGEQPDLCRPDLLAAEDTARRRGLGRWHDRDAVPQARDLTALDGAAGRFTLVQGRIVSVGVRKERTYINFGRDFARDFAVVLPRAIWARLVARGWEARGLTGRRVRARGLVERRRSPSMELASPDMLEILDEDGVRR